MWPADFGHKVVILPLNLFDIVFPWGGGLVDIKKTISVWGTFDLAAFGSYVSWQLLQDRTPFYDDILTSIQTAISFEMPYLTAFKVLFPVLFVALYVSLLFSGIWLLKQNKFGLILGFIQTPLRMAFLMPPSIFFRL